MSVPSIPIADTESIDSPPNRPPPSNAPIFLTGFARSGTTWVNRLFCDYFDAGFVNEGQFIVTFGRRLARYGDLRLDRNRLALLQDLKSDPFFAILRRNYSIEIDWLRVEDSTRDFRGIVTEVLAQISTAMGKSRIGSKYPVFGRYLDLLNRLFPDCKVVHVVRDGRDCALSQRHVVWGHQNTYAAAVHWRRYLCTARAGAMAMPGRYLEIRYEDLLTDPRSTVSVLERFITGTHGGPVTARFMADRESLKSAKVAGWRHAMAPRAQAIFEGVSGDALKDAGYPLTGVARVPSVLWRGLYTAHDRLSREGWHWARKVFPAIPEQRR